MLLHLGQDTLVHTGEVVGLFDLDSTTLGKKTREFLTGAERGGHVVNVSTELPKSFVLTAPQRLGREEDPPYTLYISQMGTATLKKRAGARAGTAAE